MHEFWLINDLMRKITTLAAGDIGKRDWRKPDSRRAGRRTIAADMLTGLRGFDSLFSLH